jgi:hypothetical protein
LEAKGGNALAGREDCGYWKRKVGLQTDHGCQLIQVRTQDMNKTVATLFTFTITTTAVAGSAIQHPLFGTWTWTRTENNCTEVYDYRPDHTSKVTSGEEIGESRFTISDEPDQHGFYRMTDVTTKDNGKMGCDGTPGGTPVGDEATMFVFIRSTSDEMVICQEPSFAACFGPLRRTK